MNVCIDTSVIVIYHDRLSMLSMSDASDASETQTNLKDWSRMKLDRRHFIKSETPIIFDFNTFGPVIVKVYHYLPCSSVVVHSCLLQIH